LLVDAHSPAGTIAFKRSFSRKARCEFVYEAIKDVGIDHVVQSVTDNISNNMRPQILCN